jgi:predicted nucleic acid-binding protein
VTLVLDASLTLRWYFEDERTPAADAILDRVVEAGAMVPALWRLKVANGLQIAMRRQRIDTGFRDKAIAQLTRMPIAVDSETDTHARTTTLHLADRFRLTLYDAAYLELAHRRVLPLASLDKELRAAGNALGVALL